MSHTNRESQHENDLRNYCEVLGRQTSQVRNDVVGIQGRLEQIGGQVSQSCWDVKRMTERVEQIQSNQNSFHQRVQEASNRVQYYKQILSSRY